MALNRQAFVLSPLFATAIGLLAFASAEAMDSKKAVVIDSSGAPVMTNYEDCVRTNYAPTGELFAACGDMPEKVAEPEPAPAPAAPAPAPAVVMVDSDNDGVADSKDQCAGTAAGVSVDASGCELDSDNDGVANSSDRCPGTEAGAEVNQFGCVANRDSDNDGIADAQDACPGTARGTAVDLRGCELVEDIALDNVQFKTGTAELDGNSQDVLKRIAAVLVANPHLKFEVAGHTDDRGNYDYNVSLSKQRAESVRDYLVDQGVDAGSLTAEGYGPDKPLVDNDTAAGRAQNRRVELVVQ